MEKDNLRHLYNRMKTSKFRILTFVRTLEWPLAAPVFVISLVSSAV